MVDGTVQYLKLYAAPQIKVMLNDNKYQVEPLYFFVYYQMIKISHKITSSLVVSSKYAFAGLPFGKKAAKPKNDLQKYDIVIAGGHLGALLSRHLHAVLGQKASIFVCYDKPTYQNPTIRPFYEQGIVTKFQMEGSPKKSVAKIISNSEGQGVADFLPEKNSVVLKNGRNVQYDHLVVATGLKPELNIPGLDDAWNDPLHPVFCSTDHPTWKTSMTKSFRFIHNFEGGEAIFYIPPYPFHTEIENYNFFLAKSYFDRAASTGLISWNSSRLTIINANDSFCPHYSRGDSFIKSEIERRNINVEYGLKLAEIKKDGKTAIFKNLKTGETVERPYNHFYYTVEAKPEDNLAKAGLADQTGQLDVDPFTLQHKKYSNIYGFGDVANLPTSKTFWAGFNQLHVVRHNVERQFNGLTPNARYDGLSEADILIDMDKAVKLSHFYGEKPNDTLSTGFMASLRYTLAKKGTKGFEKLLSFKSWGPPYHKFKKTFDGASEAPKSAAELHPSKKTA